MDKKLALTSCTEFTEMTASPLPAPGGGGVSALAGALGIALGDMVGELTVGKKKYAAVEQEMRERMTRCQEIRARLLALMDEDAENFEPLARAYGIPKEDPGRDAELERCLRLAVRAPVEIFDLCAESIGILEWLGENGSRLMISDAATGAALARGALEGAAVNIKVNTKLMKDREYAGFIDRHVDELLPEGERKAENTFRRIYGGFCV